jgi:hypothetical protein
MATFGSIGTGEVYLSLSSYMYHIPAKIYLAWHNMTAKNPLILIFLSSAPVPSASLVIMLTIYSTAFGDDAIPTGFAYILTLNPYLLNPLDPLPHNPYLLILILIFLS